MKTYRVPSRSRILSAVALLATIAVLGLVPWKLTAREILIASANDDSAKNAGTDAKAASSNATTTKFGGRIYVSVSLQSKDGNGNDVGDDNRLIAIDPNTGKWVKLAAQGFSLRVSRDGAAVAFESVVFEKEDKVYVWDLKGGIKPRSLGDVTCGRPIWSPDGKEIVVTNQVDNHEGKKSKPEKPIWTDETWKYSSDGSKKTWLPVPNTDSVEDWSSDGKWFVTCSDRHRPFGSGYQLYLISPDGAEQRRLTRGPGLNCYARFSPDGKQVVFAHQRGKNSIRTISLTDGKETAVIEEDGVKGVEAACWSPDGKYLAVSRFDWEVGPDGKYVRTAGHDNNYRFEIVSRDGKVQREIKLEGVRFLGHADWK